MGKNERPVRLAAAEVIEAETEVDPEIGTDQQRIKEARTALRNLLKEIDHPLIKSFRGSFEIELHPMGIALRGRILDDFAGTLSGAVAVPLDIHLEGAARKAELTSGNLLERDKILRAAQLHDFGKKEPRFQIMLHGDPFKAAAGPALAKSKFRKLAEKKAAYVQSGLPRGFRHELASIDLSDEKDPLVCYLMATHHGYGRPWFPVCHDSEAIGSDKAFIENGWLRSFASLSEKYSPWFLASMELALRAADARQSIEEQEIANA
jgi:CRISPR-associated endonuclease/helicase Cas3